MSLSPISPSFVSNQGGVLMAADTLGSYGSMARFPDLNRIMKVFTKEHILIESSPVAVSVLLLLPLPHALAHLRSPHSIYR